MKIIFRVHEFNETQQVSVSDEMSASLGPSDIARILREAGDWLFWHAYSEAMPVPVTEYRKMDGNGPDMMLRHKFPRLKIEVQDNCSFKQLADALRASSEYAKRLRAREDNPVDEKIAEEFTVSLSPDIAEAVRELAKADKMSPEDVISAIVEDYVIGDDDEDEEL